jgi:hypothetical protein
MCSQDVVHVVDLEKLLDYTGAKSVSGPSKGVKARERRCKQLRCVKLALITEQGMSPWRYCKVLFIWIWIRPNEIGHWAFMGYFYSD